MSYHKTSKDYSSLHITELEVRGDYNHNESQTSAAYNPFAVHSQENMPSFNQKSPVHSSYPTTTTTHEARAVSFSPPSVMDLGRGVKHHHQNLKKVALPSTGYGKFGPIHYRANLRSMLFKKWSHGYWLHVFPATINIFRSSEEMERWKEMNDAGTTTPEQQQSQNTAAMNKLVTFSLNFDTTGALRKKMRKIEERNEKMMNDGVSVESRSRSLSRNQSKVGDCHYSGLPKTYIMEEVRSKYYQKDKPLMHACKISYLGLGGRNVSAAFGSSVPRELKRLRAVIRKITDLTRKARHKKKSMDNDTGSVMFNSKFPRTARSELTALSNTMYGENTIHTRT